MTERNDRGQFGPSLATQALDHDYFSQLTPNSTWLAGFIAADGCIGQDQKRWQISQSGPAGQQAIEFVREITGHIARVTTTRPIRGQTSYGISFGSPKMVRDLQERFGITANKTLTYRWPDLDPPFVSSFLRGYVDGDGCVGVYQTPQGEPMLHLSFVGTPDFVQGAIHHFPVAGRYRLIERCRSLAEVRFHGRFAWSACRWLFADPTLYRGAKAEAFFMYEQRAMVDPPTWLVNLGRRRDVEEHLLSGASPDQVALSTGVHIRTVYRWKAKLDGATT